MSLFVIIVKIFVEDKNDNLPRFEETEYFVGIPNDAKVGDLILDAKVYDPDITQSDGSRLTYAIRYLRWKKIPYFFFTSLLLMEKSVVRTFTQLSSA